MRKDLCFIFPEKESENGAQFIILLKHRTFLSKYDSHSFEYVYIVSEPKGVTDSLL